MKRILFYSILLLFMPLTSVQSEEHPVDVELIDELDSNVLRPFFNALKNGNVEVIRRYLAGEKRQRSQFLLNDDKEYQAFLREYYKDAVFTVEQVVSSDNQVIVDVKIEFPGRGWKVTQFYLQEQQQNSAVEGAAAGKGRWRITEQQNKRTH